MALRLYSEFYSSTDKLFKVEIHDENFTGTAESFNVAGDGFTLNYSGETDDIVSPIIASKCTISAYNNTAAFDTFISVLKTYQEARFIVRVFAESSVIEDGLVFGFYDTIEPPDGGLRLYWTGLIMQDLITIEDVSKPYVFNLTAVDGIGHLANKEFSNISNITIESFLESAVNAIGLGSLYDDDDLLYATCVNSWDANHVYNADNDVTTLTRFSSMVYASKDEEGNYIYSNYLDILKEICVAFGARVYQREGVFYFEQYIERTETSRVLSAYYKNGTKAFTSSVNDDVTLDGTTTGGARLAGNMFNFLPALRKVQVSYNQTRGNNLLANRLTFTGSTGRQDLGFLVDNDNGKVQVTGELVYQFEHNGNAGSISLEFYRPVWAVELRVEDAANPGTYYYLKRNWNPNNGILYGATSWETTQSYYYVDAGMGKNNNAGMYISTSFSFISPPIPIDGEATLDVNFSNIYDVANNVQIVPSYFDATNRSTDVTATYLNDNGSLSEVTIYSSTNTDTKINSNLTLDLGTLRISDSNGIQGSFYIYNGTNWTPSTSWRRGNSGDYNTLLKLLTNEVLSIHKKPTERYNGSIVGPYPFGIRYSFDESYWLPMSGTYNANMDEWNAEWFKVQKDLTNITIDTPVGSGGGADYVGRVSGQQGTDETINAIQVTTNTSAVSGNQTIGGTLGVTGVSTLSATSVKEFTTTERVNVTINDITANEGGSENLTSSKHFNFITYEGGNGTYTITLPEAEEGVIMRFKTDDTIAANKTITLQPQTGGTIDAESTYLMDRSYDGITIMGRGGDNKWFIIQKKEK